MTSPKGIQLNSNVFFQFGVYADGSLGDNYVSRKACELADFLVTSFGDVVENAKTCVAEFDEVNQFPFDGVEDVVNVAMNTLNYYTSEYGGVGGYWEFVDGDLVFSDLSEEIGDDE